MSLFQNFIGNLGEVSNQALIALLTVLVSWLPNSTGIPSNVADSFNSLVTTVYAFEFIFPVRTLVSLLQLLVPIHLGFFVFRGINWVYNKFRGAA